MSLSNTSNSMQPEVCVLLSGGVDSTACIAFYLEVKRQPYAAFIDYQQPACRKELFAAEEIAKYYGIKLVKYKWRGQLVKSEGLIPARNAFLLTAALLELPSSVTTIAIGIHSGTNYKDCSPEFINQMQRIFDLYTNGKISISVPFLNWSNSRLRSVGKKLL